MKFIINLLLMLLVMTSFSQCTSSKKLQKKSPVSFGNAYYQHWISGIQGGGSKINLFIPVEGIVINDIRFDSVYFRGKVSKLEFKPDEPSMLIGRFNSEVNKREDIIMSNKLHEEYGNKLPEMTVKIPFKLKANECVLSYSVGGNMKYFKIENIIWKQLEYLPKTAPKKQ